VKGLCHLLQQYYDGQLHEEDVAQFCVHLEECDSCRQNLAHFNKMSDFLKLCHEKTPARHHFDATWNHVEKKILRERLSFFDVVKNGREIFAFLMRDLFKPLVAVAFILLVLLVPILDRNGGKETYAQEAEIKKIESETNNIMVLQTKKKKWCVIWILSAPKQEGENNVE